MLNESGDWKKEFMVFANYYYEDFQDFNGLDAELDLVRLRFLFPS